MRISWLATTCAVLVALSSSAFAAKPVRTEAAAALAPEIFSVKIDYTNGLVIVEGAELSPGTASATLAGVALTLDPAATDTTLLFPFSPALSAEVDELGNYVLKLTTDGGTISVSTFIPFALVASEPPPPPGPDCPCSTEWDQAGSQAPPDGFSGLTPYCSEDTGSFVTVQYSDGGSLYWVLWTEWQSSVGTGYCELWIDGPTRTLTSQDQFDACAGYLRNIVTVYGNQGNVCLF